MKAGPFCCLHKPAPPRIDLVKKRAIGLACKEGQKNGVFPVQQEEALEAWDERKRKARVLGEAAATKLLVPMVMMLAVVMAIIMIPAFLSFYG